MIERENNEYDDGIGEDEDDEDFTASEACYMDASVSH